MSRWLFLICTLLSRVLACVIKILVQLLRTYTASFIKKITSNKRSPLTLVSISSYRSTVLCDKSCCCNIYGIRLVVKVNLHAISWPWIYVFTMTMGTLHHDARLTLLFNIGVKVSVSCWRALDGWRVFELVLNVIDFLLDFLFEISRTCP
jgi:hypothetical protein